MKKIAITLLALGFSFFAATAQTTIDPLSRAHATSDLAFNPNLKPFYHGVASGDPLSDRVIIWTRVTPEKPEEQGTILVRWKVARDKDLQNIVASGTTSTDSSVDYTVHVDVMGLAPATYYYFAFEALGKSSIVGRTKTAPAANQTVDRMRFGVVSCVNYPRGYFNGFAAMAANNDLDAIIHLGDYIYEYEEGGYGYNEAVNRPIEPDNEITSLSDYRIRYSLYRLDPDLMRAHQLYPFVTVWDDHETADNSYKEGANNHTEGAEGAWPERKAAGIKAYNEWLPLRLIDPAKPEIIHRTLHYGGLMDLIMLDTRLEGRDKQAAQFSATVGPTSEYLDSTRTLLGQAQYEWLTQTLSASTAQWKVIGNQVMVSPFRVANNVPINMDQWDGYPGDQTKFLNFVRDNSISNMVVLTGDIHSSWGNDIAQNPLLATQYNPITGTGSLGVEFVCPGVTSEPFGSSFAASGSGQEPAVLVQAIKSNNPHMKYIELMNNGYLILDVSAAKTQSDWYSTGVESRNGQAEFASGWFTNAGENHLQQASAAMPFRTDVPAAPQAPILGIRNQDKAPALLGAYPNPFSDELHLHYALLESDKVSIRLLDVLGKPVQTIKEGVQASGVYQLEVNTAALPTGMYFVQISSTAGIKVLRLVK